MIKRIATAVVLIPIVLLLVLRAPVPVVAAVTAVVALLTVQEFLKLTESYGVSPLDKPTYGVVVLFFVLLMFNAGQQKPLLSTDIFGVAAAFAAAIATFVFLTIAMRRDNLATGYPAAAASAFGFAYIALPLAMLVQLRQQWAGAFLILYLLLVVWSGDIFAYFVGKAIGRHLMAPRISPKKTWEGAIASLIASMAIGGSLFYYSSQVSTTFLQWGLIQRRDGMFGLEKPALVPDPVTDRYPEHRRTTRRPGRISDQARSGCQRFRRDPPGPRRHARPHRRPALRRSSALGLGSVASHAVSESLGIFHHKSPRDTEQIP